MKKLEITEEILKLIPFLNIDEVNDDEISINKNHLFNLGSHLLEDMAMILGKMDKAIQNTENDIDGRAFDDETEEYLLGIFNYIKDNLYELETLIHQFSVKGGLTTGIYKCSLSDMIWKKAE